MSIDKFSKGKKKYIKETEIQITGCDTNQLYNKASGSELIFSLFHIIDVQGTREHHKVKKFNMG